MQRRNHGRDDHKSKQPHQTEKENNNTDSSCSTQSHDYQFLTKLTEQLQEWNENGGHSRFHIERVRWLRNHNRDNDRPQKRASVALVLRPRQQRNHASSPTGHGFDSWNQLLRDKHFMEHGKLDLLFIVRPVRTTDLYSGQVAFPGGKQEDGESLKETAERETMEEVGLRLNDTRLYHYIGRLPDHLSVGGVIIVSPFIYVQLGSDSECAFVLNADEVRAVRWAPISLFTRHKDVSASMSTLPETTTTVAAPASGTCETSGDHGGCDNIAGDVDDEDDDKITLAASSKSMQEEIDLATLLGRPKHHFTAKLKTCLEYPNIVLPFRGDTINDANDLEFTLWGLTLRIVMTMCMAGMDTSSDIPFRHVARCPSNRLIDWICTSDVTHLLVVYANENETLLKYLIGCAIQFLSFVAALLRSLRAKL